MNKNLLILLSLLFIMAGCKAPVPKVIYIQEKRGNGEFLKILPKNNGVEGNGGYSEYLYDIAKELNWKTIDYGFDSLCIRLWYFYREEKECVEFRRSSNKWSSLFSDIGIKRINDLTNKYYISSSKSLEPKSGWYHFTNEIYALGILTLPLDTNLPSDYSIAADGATVLVEIATKDYYRIYYYDNPAGYPHYEETRNIEKIMKLIENEFGVKRKYDF
ncbi:MAG TPA: hypothetical protein PKE38_16965 [Ignavibacteriaceae bacterium]|nr:hypothetical protein [Ignavibacteriaceae bacterium]